MSGYDIAFTGGQPMVRPTDDEPITEMIFVSWDTLLAACQRDGLINTPAHGPKRVLPNHRKIFLDFVRSKSSEAANV